MTKDAKTTLTPKLRFPEFRDEPGWAEKELHTLADPVSERAENGDENNILTLSAEQGLVLQREYFGKQIAGTNADRYLKIQRDDFVYNDRVTKASAYGTIKRLTRHPHGIVSPIYKCFRFKDGERPSFWEWYFEAGAHESQLRGLANEGARAGRFNVSIDRFLSTSVRVPAPGEQTKIAECLSTLDELIGAENQKLDALKAHKKGLMQQRFPREGETRPRLRFPEFQNAPAWEENEVGKIFKVTRGQVLAMTLVKDAKSDEAPYPVYSSQTKNAGLCGFYSDFLFQNAITWTTDGANAGDVNFRPGKFYCTNVCGVLLNTDGYANQCIAALINSVSRKYVSYVGNPKLMNGVMSEILIPVPTVTEQQRIASCLSSLDDLIAAQGDKLEALKTHKKGLMQQLFPSPAEAEA